MVKRTGVESLSDIETSILIELESIANIPISKSCNAPSLKFNSRLTVGFYQSLDFAL